MSKGSRMDAITVIIVPRGHRRTLNLRLPVPILTGLLVTTLFGLAASTGYYLSMSRQLHTATSAMQERDVLRQETAQKERELEQRETELQQMAQKVQEIESDLVKLRDLETQVRKVIQGEQGSASIPARQGAAAETDGTELAGAAVLETRVAPRDRVVASRSVAGRRTPVAGLLARLDGLKSEAVQRAETLAKSAEELSEHLDFLVHKPSGVPSWGEPTDPFGWRWDPLGRGGQRYHEGIDFAASRGSEIYATADGVVVYSDWKSGGYGLTVIVDHGYGFQTLYAHNSENAVQVGDKIKRGQVLAYVGNTGNSTGPHVHYEVHLWGTAVDPEDYLD